MAREAPQGPGGEESGGGSWQESQEETGQQEGVTEEDARQKDSGGARREEETGKGKVARGRTSDGIRMFSTGFRGRHCLWLQTDTQIKK